MSRFTIGDLLWHANYGCTLVISVIIVHSVHGQAPAFEGAEGFGAVARGGAGGEILWVSTLDDEPSAPRPGSLRWCVQQPGPRIVRFQVAGNIRLKAPLVVKEPFLTIDGSDAPRGGICLCDHTLAVKDSHDVVVRYLRVRHGDVETLRGVRAAGLPRPRGSGDLDCVSLDDSHNLIFDHCSLSWSCDEIFGIVRCKNVSIQWCLLAEPLANLEIHPYGDRHAYGLNLSANTLTLHHCLVAHYVMRGPQFEANDVRRGLGYDVQMEAINNVFFDYERSGSRYTTGIEDHPEEAAGTKFQFQFLNNFYVNADKRRPDIEAVLKHGVIDSLQVFVAGNIGPHRPTNDADQLAGVFTDRKQPIRSAEPNVLSQISEQQLFTSPNPVAVVKAEDAYRQILASVGCSQQRDAVDRRIVADVEARRFGHVVKSQDDVGGWPALDE